MDLTVVNIVAKTEELQPLLHKLLKYMCQKQICPQPCKCMAYLSGTYMGMHMHICVIYEVTGINHVTRRTVHMMCKGYHITNIGYTVSFPGGHIM